MHKSFSKVLEPVIVLKSLLVSLGLGNLLLFVEGSVSWRVWLSFFLNYVVVISIVDIWINNTFFLWFKLVSIQQSPHILYRNSTKLFLVFFT